MIRGIRQGTQVQEAMPIGTGARQARDLKESNGADLLAELTSAASRWNRAILGILPLLPGSSSMT